MKSKSIVQERLDATKNRLEIISREVEAQRMTTKDVARGLRHVGTSLEGIQRFVTTDKDMKFQDSISKKLETGMSRLMNVIHALEGAGVTNDNLNGNLTQSIRIIESVQELVDLEIETLS